MKLPIIGVLADGLEQVLDHQTGTIEALDLLGLSVPEATKAVHRAGNAMVINPREASVK